MTDPEKLLSQFGDVKLPERNGYASVPFRREEGSVQPLIGPRRGAALEKARHGTVIDCQACSGDGKYQIRPYVGGPPTDDEWHTCEACKGTGKRPPPSPKPRRKTKVQRKRRARKAKP